MRFARLACLSVLLVPGLSIAESKILADYPLRIHIFNRSETNFYHNRYQDEAKGEGHANLFENSVAHGVDFSFDCSEKIHSSFGYETYPAKWKKPGQELVVLFPVFGKAGSFFTCNLTTDVKDFAYATHNHSMKSESVEEFKAWMVKHNYDPEHGKNMPTQQPGDAPVDTDPGAQ